jgi:cyclic pyranopterin phosphate synthase
MLSHIDKNNQPGIVDISDKDVTDRRATAQATIVVPPEVVAALEDGDIQTKKGPVFQTAIIAGTMAVKRTSDLIPLCHPLPITGCKLHIETDTNRFKVTCSVKVHHKTGVEMEALTGATVAALTIYDMCKAITHDMQITDVRLVEKSGGKREVCRES